MRDKLLDIIENICGDEIVKENPDINLLEEDLIDSLDYVSLLLDIQDEYELFYHHLNLQGNRWIHQTRL